MLESLFNKAAGLKVYNFIETKTPTQVFSCKYCEIFKNSFFDRTPWVAASVLCFQRVYAMYFISTLFRQVNF